MKRFISWLTATIGAGALVLGCSGSLTAKCNGIASTYEPIQLGILAAVETPQTPPATKATLKLADKDAVRAISACYDAAAAGDAKGVTAAMTNFDAAATSAAGGK